MEMVRGLGGLRYLTGLIDVTLPALGSVGGWECGDRMFLVVIDSSGLIDGALPDLLLVDGNFGLGVLALGLKLTLLGTSLDP